MCLDTTEKYPMKAECDIECYKVVCLRPRADFRSPEWGVMMVSPYRNFEYEVGNTYTEKEFCMDLPLKVERFSSRVKYYEANKGFHAFKNFQNAVEEVSYWGFAVMKCVIPKGSWYYLGTFTDAPCYCSDKIKVVSVMHYHSNEWKAEPRIPDDLWDVSDYMKTKRKESAYIQQVKEQEGIVRDVY